MTIEANWHDAKDIFVAEITSSGTGVAEGGVTYYPHAWTERELSTTGRAYTTKAGARVGTVTVHPAFTLDGSAVDAGTLVFMRQRGWVNATSIEGDVYDILSVAVSQAEGCVEVVTDVECVDGSIVVTTTYIRAPGLTSSSTPC